MVVVLLVVTGGGATYTAGAVVEYSVVVVVGGTSSAQAPIKTTDTATAAAKATFFRSFIVGLPPLGTSVRQQGSHRAEGTQKPAARGLDRCVFGIGLAGGGQGERNGHRRTKSDSDSIPISIPTYSLYLGRDAKTSQDFFIWLCGGRKISVGKDCP